MFALSDLDPGLRETDLAGEFLPGKDVRVVGLAEHGLQLLQLLQREGGPVPALLPPQESFVMEVGRIAQCRICAMQYSQVK